VTDAQIRGRVVLFMSGYSAEDLHPQSASPFEGAMLQKPFTPEELVRSVAAALARDARS
jgi:DNA-binding response OmpR family regulator